MLKTADETSNNGLYIILNKNLINSIGINEALLYSELFNRMHQFNFRGNLTDDGYFPCTIKEIEDEISLSRKQQDLVIKKLKDVGLIEIKVLGLPAKRHFKIISNHVRW